MLRRKSCILLVIVLVAMLMPAQAGSAQTIGTERGKLFTETNKTVKGRFFEYWETHGGVAQQGYPISEELWERSETDGKMYKVQYFERAVFELHPENKPPNDVLLSLLGVFLYKQKYPEPGGAPNQTPNKKGSSSVLFTETGKYLDGIFLEYWQKNGGLAQQGFPISDEFNEKSALDGKTYKVQYFERAVFEWHLENDPPYNVLLSQLGTFRFKAKYPRTPTPNPSQYTPTPTPTVAPPSPTPTRAPATPTVTATPTRRR